MVIGGRRARHHVQRRLGHVGVRMAGRLEPPVKLPLDRGHVHDVFVTLRRAEHQRLETRVENEGRDGVDELHFEQLDRRHLVQQQAPRVAPPPIDLLQIPIEPSLWEQVLLRAQLLGQQLDLRELRRVRESREVSTPPRKIRAVGAPV